MTIQELEKISPIGDSDASVIKYRDVINNILNVFTNKNETIIGATSNSTNIKNS